SVYCICPIIFPLLYRIEILILHPSVEHFYPIALATFCGVERGPVAPIHQWTMEILCLSVLGERSHQQKPSALLRVRLLTRHKARQQQDSNKKYPLRLLHYFFSLKSAQHEPLWRHFGDIGVAAADKCLILSQSPPLFPRCDDMIAFSNMR